MKNTSGVGQEIVFGLFETMLRIRLFEKTQSRVFRAGEQQGFTHLYIGEEAVAAGVCANLRIDDYITSTHRGHGHMIAKGGDFKSMMAELYGRTTGACLGRSGSLHIADRQIGMLGANGIVGDGNPLAVGAGYSIKLRRTDQVVVSFFGDGATNQGSFHEALNMAASWNLPVVFVIENNLLSCGVKTETVCKVSSHLSDRAIGYGIPGQSVNGMDVAEVYAVSREAIERARAGQGPTLLDCSTFRHQGHFEGDVDIRSKEEIESHRSQDAILALEQKMIADGFMTREDADALRESIQLEVDAAVEFARNSPHPEPEDAMKFVYAE